VVVVQRKNLVKNAIAVYNPQTDWEEAIESASKKVTGQWLPSHSCQLLARAVACLKCDDDWVNDEKLMGIRAFYLFSPQMISNKDELVFVTHLLYLRDILENQEINAVLHAPITFITKPLAHFLFRDCPIHIRINNDMLRAQNKKADIIDIGGCTISENDNINLEDVICGITYVGEKKEDAEKTQMVIDDIQNKSGFTFTKAAAQEIQEDIFMIEEHHSAITPASIVWDKLVRVKAEVIEIEPSENGLIKLRYVNGNEKNIPKQEFDQRFSVEETAYGI